MRRKEMDPQEWDRVIEALRRTAERYDLVNGVISLGFDSRMRRALAEEMDYFDDMVVLDAGCGPGTLSEKVLKRMKSGKLLLLDPLPEMLRLALLRLDGIKETVTIEVLEGTFEDIPLPDSSVHAVISAFAIRDSRDLDAAMREFKRILVPGGQLLILDLVRPDNRLLAGAVGLYIRFLVPLITVPLYGSPRTPWLELYPTYRDMLTSGELVQCIGEYFEVVRVRKAVGGTFTLVKAIRP